MLMLLNPPRLKTFSSQGIAITTLAIVFLLHLLIFFSSAQLCLLYVCVGGEGSDDLNNLSAYLLGWQKISFQMRKNSTAYVGKTVTPFAVPQALVPSQVFSSLPQNSFLL